MSLLHPHPAEFRAEIARHRIPAAELAELARMHPALISGMLQGNRPMRSWAAHNIGYAINRYVRAKLFDVDMKEGLRPAPKGRPKTISQYPLTPLGQRRKTAPVLY